MEVKLSQKLRAKKGLHSLLQPMLSFLSHTIFFYENCYKTTAIEYVDVTVLLVSLNLTALLEYLI